MNTSASRPHSEAAGPEPRGREHRRWRFAFPVVALLVVLASQTVAGAANSNADSTLAQQATLQSSDVPAAFTGTSVDPQASTQLERSLRGIAACHDIASQVARSHRSPRAVSPDFSNAAGNDVQSTVVVFGSPASAKAYLAAFQARAARPCIQQVVVRTITSRSPQQQFTSIGSSTLRTGGAEAPRACRSASACLRVRARAPTSSSIWSPSGADARSPGSRSRASGPSSHVICRTSSSGPSCPASSSDGQPHDHHPAGPSTRGLTALAAQDAPPNCNQR